MDRREHWNLMHRCAVLEVTSELARRHLIEQYRREAPDGHSGPFYSGLGSRF
jgi:hypothetical protein